jgi:hypothetical protein
MRHFSAFFLVFALFTLTPAAAQEESLLDWIPAEFDAFIRIDMSDAAEMLDSLNNGVFVATVLQPTRMAIENALSYDDFFPLAVLDVENVSFETAILPWLGDELIIAYRNLPPDYRVARDDVLAIFPTDDAFGSANTLSDVIQAQDLLEPTTYRGMTIYQGDRISLAFTPLAVLIGSEDAIRMALDTEAGDAPALTSDATYQSVRAAMDDNPPLFTYLRDEAAAASLAYLLSGREDTAPLLAAVGEAFADVHRVETIEAALLNGELDAVGVSLQIGTVLPRNVGATVVVHTAEEGLIESSSAFDSAVLEFVPRSALLVQSGADVQNTAYISLAALPMANFAARVLGGFPIQPTPGALSGLPAPTAENLEIVVNDFTAAVEDVNGIDLFDDVLDHLDGSYTFALLPRPNDPLPILNTPFDALLVAQVNDGEEMLANLSDLLEVFLGAESLETEQMEDQTFTTLFAPDTDEPLLRMGLVDDLLLIATGDSARIALNAWHGDNRLISQERWQVLNEDTMPNLYVDIPAFYNTFLPISGGQTVDVLRQVGIHSRSLGDGLYEIKLRVTLPEN